MGNGLTLISLLTLVVRMRQTSIQNIKSDEWIKGSDGTRLGVAVSARLAD